MRILQLHNDHATFGGALEVLTNEGELLREQGHDVDTYLMPAADTLQLSKVRASAKAIWNREVAGIVADRIRAFRPDVVHVHTPFPLMSPSVFRAAAKLRVPCVATVHSYRYSCIAATCHRDGAICEACVGTVLKLPGVIHRCYHDSVGASGALTAGLVLHRTIGTFRDVNRFITLTEFAKQLLVRDGIAAAHVTVKPNFVPDPGGGHAREPAQPYVAFVGRLVDVKGVQTMLDAWSAGIPGLTLRIAGDGPLRGLVEERAGADASIEYLGWLEEHEVTELMAKASCVLVPSEWYEAGVPLVVLHSLAVGTPVVVSDLENICADVLRDGTGASFATGDAAALADTLRSVLTDAEGWARRRSAARTAYEERYTPTANAAALLAIYRQVVAEDVGRRHAVSRSSSGA